MESVASSAASSPRTSRASVALESSSFSEQKSVSTESSTFAPKSRFNRFKDFISSKVQTVGNLFKKPKESVEESTSLTSSESKKSSKFIEKLKAAGSMVAKPFKAFAKIPGKMKNAWKERRERTKKREQDAQTDNEVVELKELKHEHTSILESDITNMGKHNIESVRRPATDVSLAESRNLRRNTVIQEQQKVDDARRSLEESKNALEKKQEELDTLKLKERSEESELIL
jgi:hypothetical protein